MDETTVAIAIATTAAVACLGTLLLYTRNKSSATTSPTLSRAGRQDGSSSSSPPSSSCVQREQQEGGSSHGAARDDVWEERRRRGIAAASSHGAKKEASVEKPFSSSYYYAHNNSKATGGYKDGLAMEDFTMNGPRLLSRGGKPLKAGEERDPNESALSTTATTGSAADCVDEKREMGTPIRTSSKTSRRTLSISKYLWDDPGDASGVAAIRIEQLPGTVSHGPGLDWATARSLVTRIDAQQREGGLLLSVFTSGEIDYSLTIPRFYGDVEAVEHMNKAKRLIVRIKKKRGMFSRSNTKAWPYPHKKVE
jgi:hypothetical protein